MAIATAPIIVAASHLESRRGRFAPGCTLIREVPTQGEGVELSGTVSLTKRPESLGSGGDWLRRWGAIIDRAFSNAR